MIANSTVGTSHCRRFVVAAAAVVVVLMSTGSDVVVAVAAAVVVVVHVGGAGVGSDGTIAAAVTS